MNGYSFHGTYRVSFCKFSGILIILAFSILQYCDKYADFVGFPHLEEWRKELCISALVNSDVNLETYRDCYDDEDLLQVAKKSPHFTQLEPEAFCSL